MNLTICTAYDPRASLVREGGDEEINNNLKTRKTIESIVGFAKISDEPWEDEGAVGSAAEADTDKPKKTAKKPKSSGDKSEEKSKKKEPSEKKTGPRKTAKKAKD